jgi:hypothetical protein
MASVDTLGRSDSSAGLSDGHVRFVDSTIRYGGAISNRKTVGNRFQRAHLSGHFFRYHTGAGGCAAFWQGRSGLEKGLIVLTLVLAAFCTIMLLIGKSHETVFNVG